MSVATATDEIIQNNKDYTLFSWLPQAGIDPINVARAKGVYVYDRDDKRYLDFSSQLMNVNIGHGDTRIRDAVVRQMDEVSYVYPGMATQVRGALGKKLASLAPGKLTKTFFTLGGADAIENAIKLARTVTGRHKIFTRYRSYHGSSYGAFSAGGDPRRLAVDAQAMPNVVHFEAPYTYRSPWANDPAKDCDECIARLDRTLQFEGLQNVAAIILEGESGSSGCLKYPAGYLSRVKELCERYGILFIADEVMSGFGRTGKWFGVENHNVEPDILCFAKGVTSGYLPLGGLIVTDALAHAFDQRALPLGLTYSAHAVACAAARECIRIYEADNLIERAQTMGAYIEKSVAMLEARHPCIGDFRNTGMLGCIELVRNRETKEPLAPWNATGDEMKYMQPVAAHFRAHGLFTFVRWNYIFIAPPLIITEGELDEGFAIIDDALTLADRAC